LVSFFDQLRAKGRTVYEAVMEGSRLRIRAVMMTTLTTLAGLVPMLYAAGAGSEIQKPLVAVVFGGLISALLLELVVLPVLYVMLHRDETAVEP
jgi:cobalt-zinc-cadmium resistance protein CzcA